MVQWGHSLQLKGIALRVPRMYLTVSWTLNTELSSVVILLWLSTSHVFFYFFINYTNYSFSFFLCLSGHWLFLNCILSKDMNEWNVEIRNIGFKTNTHPVVIRCWLTLVNLTNLIDIKGNTHKVCTWYSHNVTKTQQSLVVLQGTAGVLWVSIMML